MKKFAKIILIILILIIMILFFSRLTSPREIDDVHPQRLCEENYLDKSDILWVMPMYQHYPISKNKTWCQEILSLNKTLGMHGITHEFHEFKNKITEEKLIQGKQIFEKCFGYEPTLFKPPYLRLSRENKKLLEENNLTIKKHLNQNIHKVYHCSNSGTLPNRLHDLI